ncbi:MAG: hypothetical protein E5V91_22815 [Mesorhizobium sp.]|nr:MAG: hypothetical protein E5V91_22815 [Mesorhizobium sp.]
MADIPATARHEALHEAFLAAIRKTASDMPAEEILAVTCVLVGQLIAMQDQRRFTPAAVMQLVSRNIEAGNQRVIADLLKAPGGRA